MINVNELKNKIFSYRKQEEIMNKWLKLRLDNILPMLMKRSKIDLWIVACNEYNEDPVFKVLAPVSMISARRLTIFVYYLNGDTVERYALSRSHSDLNDYYLPYWDWLSEKETQIDSLNRLIQEKNPNKIALNYSSTNAFADGLSHSLYHQIYNSLNELNKEKVCSAIDLCIGILETRLEQEINAYYSICEIGHSIIANAFSSNIITKGITTNSDVKYYLMQKVIDLGLKPWFDFSVDIYRNNQNESRDNQIIEPGDLLHLDFGFTYLGLSNDIQELAYVLKDGEEIAPNGLIEGLALANSFQDIVVSSFKTGDTGNMILKNSLNKAKKAGLNASLYTHAIGYYGHSAGLTIGLTDKQEEVLYDGSHPLFNNTLHSLELNIKHLVKEWNNQVVMFPLETDIIYKDDKVYYAYNRQKEFHYVK